jgi:protein TonB
MTPLQYSTGSFRVSRHRTIHSPQQRAFGIVFAVLMEAAIVYALLVTLGYVEAPLPPSRFTVVNVAPVNDDPPIPVPPPQTFDPPPVVQPVTPVIQLTYDPPPPVTAISTPPPQPVLPLPQVTPAPPPPVVFTPARGIQATHTTPEYPFLSRRLREQGTLRLKISIDERGIVTRATVVNSSGFNRLDEAAVNWVKAHWRYTPALQGTRPVASTADAIVEFRLQ